jgi:hypothetical protein
VIRYPLALLTALVFVPAAAALAVGGPNPAGLQDNEGALSGDVRFVASKSGANSMLSARTKDGSVLKTLALKGQWGIPRIDTSAGISFDGKTLVLARTALRAPTTFTVVDTAGLRVRKTVTLRGNYAYDALSPNGSMLFLVKFSGDTTNRYVVKALDLRTGKLLPGRIADKTQNSWVMQGLPVSRTTSTDGRWVYTLYANPGGYAFVHALDTVNRSAHCVGVPWKGDENRQWDMRLGLRDDGTLGINWQSGAPYVAIDLASWKINYLT